LNKYIKYNSGG